MPAVLAFLLAPALVHAQDNPSPTPTPTPTPAPVVVMEEIDLIGTVHRPELQIFVERQPLPDLSTEELLERIDARLEDLAAARD